MNVVTVELIGNSVLVWPDLNVLSSALLTTKYSILHRIAIANWMPRLHITTISKDLAALLYAIGTNVAFDMTNVIFQVIVSYVEAETTIGGLPFFFLIHEVLTVQKDGLVEDDDLEMPRKPLKIFTKVYTSAHVQDVGNKEFAIDFDVLIVDLVATS